MSSSVSNAAGSSSHPATPIRAITSSFTSRPAPSVPLPSQAYEPLVKHILQQRLIRNIFFCSGVVCWLQSTLWTIWSHGGIERLGSRSLVAPFFPCTLVSAGATWLVAALPAVIVRKAYLAVKQMPATSPATAVKSALSKDSTRRSTMTYLLSSLCLLILHVTSAYLFEKDIYGDPKLKFFVKSRKHPYYLNGRLAYLVFSQVAVALAFSLRSIMLDRFAFRFSNTYQNRPVNLFNVVQALMVTVILSTFVIPATCAAFAAARLFLPLFYKLPLLPYILRPFTAHFLRGSWTIMLPARHFSLLVRAWFLAYTTLLTWEFSDVFFDAYISQPLTVSYLTPDPNVVLVSGVSSKGPFQYFAYSELKALAASDSASSSAQRSALFADQKFNPNLWSRLIRESLLFLGHDYQLLLRRGKPAAPAAAPTEQAKPKSETRLPFPATPIRYHKDQVFKETKGSPVRSIVDSLASDGPLAKAVDDGTDNVKIPELFRSVMGEAKEKVIPVAAKEQVKNGMEKVAGLSALVRSRGEMRERVCSFVEGQCPVWLRDVLGRGNKWWTTERVNKVVDACVPNRELDIMIVEVISHLTCASLSEDRYGVVQRDIPKILEAMLSFLSAVEEYQVSINAMYTEPKPEDNLSPKEIEDREILRVEVEKAKEILSFVGDGLKEGVGRIVRTFGDKLLAFKFPPRIAHKLQGFMDYC
ncbi:hypothetical protein AX17_002061 [Amanita inopinata Kibby_2008]|nr:hypothetical protein AX17_002061 [Amanita inopinata Kibby_2008]